MLDEKIKNTLGSGDDKEKYYVYMLINKETMTPFYVGKGEGDRILQHENNANKYKNEIDKLYKVGKISDSERKEMLSTSEKCKQIYKLGQNVEKIIIKWGLTENEAFMSESALINFCEFKGIELTNSVNGHSSKKERFCKAEVKTKARTLAQFENECAGETVKISKNSDKILFLKINKLFRSEMSDDEIYDAVRGFWRISENTIKNIEYVFAVYNSQIVGTYKVNRNSWQTLENGTKEFFPKRSSEEAELVKNNKYQEYKNLSPEQRNNINLKFFDGKEATEDSFLRLKNKYYFYVSEENRNSHSYLHKFIEFDNNNKKLKCRSNIIKSW